MTTYRVRTVWSGIEGPPGFTVMYFSQITGVPVAVASFWTAMLSKIPRTVTLTVEGTGDIIDETTGLITGSWVEAAPAPMVGTGDSEFAGPAGASIRWETGQIVAGHRVRGKTFVVPIPASSFGANGRINAASFGVYNAAAAAFAAASSIGFVIWSRPRAASVAPARPHPQRNGSVHPVIAGNALSNAAVLRSRRD